MEEDLPKKNLGQMQQDGEFRVIEKFIQSGDTVFDGGGNVGFWSEHVLKTKDAINLYTFEPTPNIFAKMQERLGSFASKLFMVALSDVDGYKEFFCYPGGAEYYNSFFDWKTRPKQKIKVLCRAIDSFCVEHGIEHIDFLKLDIEGAEFVALTGAKKMLESKQIKYIQFEYNEHPRANLRGIYTLLSRCGYALYKILPNHLSRISNWHNGLADKKFINYLAVAPGVTIEALGL